MIENVKYCTKFEVTIECKGACSSVEQKNCANENGVFKQKDCLKYEARHNEIKITIMAVPKQHANRFSKGFLEHGPFTFKTSFLVSNNYIVPTREKLSCLCGACSCFEVLKDAMKKVIESIKMS